MFTDQDLKQLSDRGISAETAQAQLKRFETGFPWLRLESAATLGHGIVPITPSDENRLIAIWNDYRAQGGSIEKFVPASGAASRMFKNLYAFVDSGRNVPDNDFETAFVNNIHKFAFYASLNAACKRIYGIGANQLIDEGRAVEVARTLLSADGLNYGAMPKGLLQFHMSSGVPHTPVEEHMEEGAQYACDTNRHVQLHFTVSPEHRGAFKALIERVQPMMEKVWGATFTITMSEQQACTDTLAANADGTPYRDSDGKLVLRPAGHGALLNNLSAREASVVFIKNIDNVVPQARRAITTRYKKVIGGLLIEVQRTIAKHLHTLEGEPTAKDLKQILQFVEKTLFTVNPATATMSSEELKAYLCAKLNRPIRVCGMVRNEGEPGGGPYLAYNADGSYSPQILEAAQINPDDDKAVAMMKGGTHFNPVDLVCYIRDYKGNKFDLSKFVDPETGLISEKSKGGTTLLALELPGLWNGSMSDWNTIFAEVPIETFNPVKTVNDLLRPQHQ